MAETRLGSAAGQTDANPATTGKRSFEGKPSRSTGPWLLFGQFAGLVHFTLAALMFFGLAYLLGRGLLVGPIGNDSPLHVANSEWFDQYLPAIPNWFPLHGGGMSIQRSYPIASYLIVAGVHRISGLSVLQAYRVVGFVTLPLAAMTLYLFCCGAFRSKTVGLIAGVLFLLSPISWSWIFEQGYLATTVAVVTLPLALLGFDRLLACWHKGSGGLITRLWFLLLVVSLAFTALAHAVVAASAVAGVGFYFVFYALVTNLGGRIRLFSLGAKAVIVSGMAAAALAAAWLVPVQVYGGIANREGLNTLAPSSIPHPTLAELFAQKPINAAEWGWFRDSSFPTVVGLMFILGAVLSIVYSRRVLAFALTGAAAIGYLLVPDIAVNIMRVWSMWPLIFRVRSFLVLGSVLFPAVAAYAAWGLARTLVNPLGLFSRWRQPARKDANRLWPIARGLAASVLAIIVAGVFVYLFRSVSSGGPDTVNYGVSRNGFDPHDIWGTGTESTSFLEQLAPDRWPALSVSNNDGALEQAKNLAAWLPKKDFLRIDLSPHLGRLAQSLPVYAAASQMNTYIFNGNLNHAIWGYQVNVYFNQDPPDSEYGTPYVLNQAAQWFGTEYVFLRPDQDRPEMYEAANWEVALQLDGIEVWKDPDVPGLATVSARPMILVISRDDIRAYEQVFRIANLGAMPYQEVFLVQGRGEVDSYRAEELQQFDAVILHGYSYRNSVRAWAVLEQYVKQGGALYVDTGWQWTVPEWEFLYSPTLLPVSTLKWTNYGMTSDYRIGYPEISGEVDPARFSPLAWEGGPWGLSGAKPTDVRDWGEVVLSAAGQPLVVAGEFGEGRVVWSGMNLVSHAIDKKNDEEIRLLHNVVAWLISGKGGADYPLTVTRSYPDRVRFQMRIPPGEKATLLWRESYYPAWHAYVVSGDGERREVPIYRGGPGFMLMPIEGVSGDAHVELEWETPLVERLATAISVLTFMALGAFLTDGLLLGGRVYERLAHRVRWPKRRHKPKGSVEWLPEAGANAGGRLSANASDEVPLDLIVTAPTMNGSADESPPYDAVESGDGEDVRALWQQLVESRKSPAAEDSNADQMIEWWRRVRERDDHGN